MSVKKCPLKLKKNRFVFWPAFKFHMHIATRCSSCKIALIYTCLIEKSHDGSRFSQEFKINAL